MDDLFRRVVKASESLYKLLAYGENVIPFDLARRKSSLERRARKAKTLKAKQAQKRKEDNDKVLKQYNIKKGK